MGKIKSEGLFLKAGSCESMLSSSLWQLFKWKSEEMNWSSRLMSWSCICNSREFIRAPEFYLQRRFLRRSFTQHLCISLCLRPLSQKFLCGCWADPMILWASVTCSCQCSPAALLLFSMSRQFQFCSLNWTDGSNLPVSSEPGGAWQASMWFYISYLSRKATFTCITERERFHVDFVFYLKLTYSGNEGYKKLGSGI